MTLPASGIISLNDIALELRQHGGVQISLNDTKVRSLLGVPSGQISLNTAHGKEYRKSINLTITDHTPNYRLDIVWSSFGTNNYLTGGTDVSITIDSGIYVYATGTGTAAFVLTGGAASTGTGIGDGSGDKVTINNNGKIIGCGGAGVSTNMATYNFGPQTTGNTGSNGGAAINLSGVTSGVTVTVNNNSTGYIAGGGGGGGSFYCGGGGGAGGGAGGSMTTVLWGYVSQQTAAGGSGGSVGSNGSAGGTTYDMSYYYCMDNVWEIDYLNGGGGGGGRVIPATTAGASGEWYCAGGGYFFQQKKVGGRSGNGGGGGGSYEQYRWWVDTPSYPQLYASIIGAPGATTGTGGSVTTYGGAAGGGGWGGAGGSSGKTGYGTAAGGLGGASIQGTYTRGTNTGSAWPAI